MTTAVRTSSTQWTPARAFLIAVAVTHLPLGGIGLIVDQSFPIGSSAAKAGERAYILGVLETNGWHSLAAVLLGALAVVVLLFRPHLARPVALTMGIFHIGLVVQLSIWDPSTVWIASNGADQVIHASTAVCGTLTGLATKRGS